MATYEADIEKHRASIARLRDAMDAKQRVILTEVARHLATWFPERAATEAAASHDVTLKLGEKGVARAQRAVAELVSGALAVAEKHFGKDIWLHLSANYPNDAVAADWYVIPIRRARGELARTLAPFGYIADNGYELPRPWGGFLADRPSAYGECPPIFVGDGSGGVAVRSGLPSSLRSALKDYLDLAKESRIAADELERSREAKRKQDAANLWNKPT